MDTKIDIVTYNDHGDEVSRESWNFRDEFIATRLCHILQLMAALAHDADLKIDTLRAGL